MVECSQLNDSLASFNDDDAGVLTAGFISLTGFGGNGAQVLMRCRVISTSLDQQPIPEDFAIQVIDATDIDLVAVVPVVSISLIDPLYGD
jgi:hypothetical protein